MGILPTEPTPPKKDLRDFIILAHGLPKMGKTHWASHFENGLFLATESGQGAITAHVLSISTWETFLQACSELASGKHDFRVAVIDTIDLLYSLCQEYVCRKHRVEYEGDLSYGKGFTLVTNEFQRVVVKLSHLPLGLVMIAHSERETIETRTGSYQRIVPLLRDKARRLICGISDLILLFDQETVADGQGGSTTRRVIRTKPSPYWEAGDRTGLLPETIEMDFAKFSAAFEEAVANLAAGSAATIPSDKEKAE
jgi:hypothetical protein